MNYNFVLREPDNFATLALDENFDGFSYCIVDDYLYLFGGGDSSINSPSKQIMYVYSILENTWTKKEDTNIPTDLMNAASLSYNGEIYFFGGYKTNLIRKYRTYTEEWFLYDPGFIPTSTGINCANGYYVSKPFVKDDFAYLACTTAANASNLQYGSFKYDLKNNDFNSNSIGIVYAQTCNYFEYYDNDNKNFQFVRASITGVGTGYLAKNSKTAGPYIWGYEKQYTNSTQKFTTTIVAKIDDSKIIDIRPDFDNSYKTCIKMLNSNDALVTDASYDDAEEVEHYFDDEIHLTFGEAQAYNIKDSKGRIVVPFFTSEDKNEIKLLMIDVPNYITNSDQTIETTSNNQIVDIFNIINVNIDYDLNQDTNIKIALSTDNKATYKYFDGSSWKKLTNKNMNLNNEGMSPDVFKQLTTDNFKLLFGGGKNNTLDILVSLYSTNSNFTPKIRSISIKTNSIL